MKYNSAMKYFSANIFTAYRAFIYIHRLQSLSWAEEFLQEMRVLVSNYLTLFTHTDVLYYRTGPTIGHSGCLNKGVSTNE